MNYLDFEEPIKDLDKQLSDCIDLGEKSDIDVSETRIKIQNKLDQTIKEIYSDLTPGKGFKFQDTLIDLIL